MIPRPRSRWPIWCFPLLTLPTLTAYGQTTEPAPLPLPPPPPVLSRTTLPSGTEAPTTAPSPGGPETTPEANGPGLPPPPPAISSLTPATAPTTRPVTQPAVANGGGSGSGAQPLSTPLPSPTTQSGPSEGSSQLNEVVVTADLDRARDAIVPSLGAVTYSIGPNQIASVPGGENATFQQVLLRAPGVVEDSFGQEHVRGEHGNLTYSVNGVLLPEGLNGFGQELDTRIVQSVTLIDGSLPAQYGFRTAGIIDVTTKSGTTLNGNQLTLYGGSYDTIQPSIQLGGSVGKFDYFIVASYKYNDLGVENPTSSVWPLHDYTDQEKAFAYLAYRIDDTSRVSLLLNGSYADFQIPDTPGKIPAFTLAGHPTADSASDNENQNEQDYYSVISWQKSEDDLSFQLSAFSRYGQIRFDPDPIDDLIFQGVASTVTNSFFTNGVQFDSSYVLNPQHTLRAGLLAYYTSEKLDTNTLVFPAAPDGTQTSDVPFAIGDDSGNTAWSSGIYLQDEWKMTDHLTLNYGARYDRFDASFEHEDQVSPRVNLVWKIDDATTAHGGYSRYFAPPPPQYVQPETLRKFTGTTNAPENYGDSPTPVERSNYYDLGISHRITKPWQVTLDGFYKGARDLNDLGQFGNAIILSPYSYREGSVYGGELSSTYKSGGLSLFGNFAYVDTRARGINSSQYQFANDELAYIATHYIKLDHESQYTASAGVSYTWKDNRVYLDLLYGSGLRSGFANLQKEPEYVPVNVGFEHIYHPDISGIHDVKFRFDIINLFDEVYQLRSGTGIGVSAAQYGQRRTFLAGLTFDF